MPTGKAVRRTDSESKRLVAEAESFPFLVHRVVERRYGGTLLRAKGASAVPYTTLWRWERGYQRVDYRLVKRFCADFGLDFDAVWALVERDLQRHAHGESVPAPHVQRRRGPRPSRPLPLGRPVSQRGKTVAPERGKARRSRRAVGTDAL